MSKGDVVKLRGVVLQADFKTAPSPVIGTWGLQQTSVEATVRLQVIGDLPFRSRMSLAGAYDVYFVPASDGVVDFRASVDRALLRDAAERMQEHAEYILKLLEGGQHG